MEELETKKKYDFNKGLFYGILIASIVIIGGVRLYVGLSGNKVVIGSGNKFISSSTELLDKETVAKIEEITNYMDINFYEDIDEQEIRNSMYAGIVEGLNDPYSVYYTREEYQSMQVSTSGVYCGIGVALVKDAKTKVVKIIKVYEGTPAEEAGIMKDDQIVSVEDVDASKKELSDLVDLISGEEGATVHMKILRPSTNKTYEVDLERRDVEIPSVESNLAEEGIGYIRIYEFQKNTPDQFMKRLNHLKDQGMKSLIVDLRDNPGGLLTSVVSLLDKLLPEGILVYTQDKYGNRQNYFSKADCEQIPMVVLVNGNSASASEIFAGAMKDYEAATILGTTTYGKGIVQSVIQLEDNDAIKITTAKYYTPKGNYIHGVGITPDVELEYQYTGPQDKKYDQKYDNQLQKALKLLRQKESS